MTVSVEFFDIYMGITIEVYYIVSTFLFGYWITPFIHAKARAVRTAYFAAFIIWILNLAGRYIECLDGIGRLTTILAFIIPVIVLYLMDGKTNLRQKIFLCVLYLLIKWLPLEFFSEIGFFERDLILDWWLFRESIPAIVIEYVVWNIIQYGGSLLLLYLSIRLLHKYYIRKNENLTWSEFIMLLMPTGSLLVVRPIVGMYYRLWMDGIANGSIKANIPGNIYRILFCILSYLSVLVTIIFYQRLKEKQEDEYARKKLDSQLEDMKRDMERIDDMYENMRAMRHDMGNHLTVIKGLAESGRYTELAEYIAGWKGSFEVIQQKFGTGNAVTDVVLSDYARRCDRAGILFDCEFHYPDGTDFNAFDISIVLANAIQNACEASEGIDSPKISVASVFRDRVFIINVRNIIMEKAVVDNDGIPYSTKGNGHGYGLKNIRNIAGKYKGDIEIRQEKSGDRMCFVLNVMMVL